MSASRNLLTYLASRLSNLRLATVLILLLIVACAAGGLIPQSPVTPNAQAIYRSYGLFWYRLITRLQLDDVFSSAWFFALIGLFALNLLLCTVRRLRGSLRRAFGLARFAEVPSESSQTMKIPMLASPATIEKPVSEAIRRVGFSRVDRYEGANGRTQLVGRRRRWGMLGADVIHVGILVILLGALLGIFREEGSFRIHEWQTGLRLAACGDENGGDCVPMTYDVQVDGFGVETYGQTERVKDYWAHVVLWEGEDDVERARVSVNRPLTIGGTGLYVWRYGEDPDSALVRLQVVDIVRNIVTAEMELRVGETAPIPGSQAWVTAVRFYRTLAANEVEELIDRGNTAGGYSAVLLQIDGFAENGEDITYRDLALPFLSKPDADQEVSFLLSDARLPTFIDLHVTRNPGYPFFWWGFILVMIGLAVAFYLRPSTVRVVIETNALHVCEEGRQGSRRAKLLARELAAIHGLDSQEEFDW